MEANNTTVSLMTNGTISQCEEPSESAVRIYETWSWFFENVLQSIVGLAGIMANSLAIPILCSKEMSSIFNRLLVLLAIYDNFYILCSVLEAMRKSNPHNEVHEVAFALVLFPLHNFVLCGSIFLTVALALERYRAVWRPIEYHNQFVGVNPWRRVLVSYLLPVVIFSSIFNIPKLLEVELMVKTEWEVVKEVTFDEATNASYETNVSVPVNRSFAAPTDLRLDDTYVVLYVNIARLLVQGIIPFICLSFLNYRIYWVMKRRSQLVNRPAQQQQQQPNGNGTSAQQKKANEAQQAGVLFVIVLLFFICQTPRLIINIHEFLTLDTLREAIDTDCNSISLWVLGATSVSHCLMTLNSSVNFFIYAFTSSTFRDVLRKHIDRITPQPVMDWMRERQRRSNEIPLQPQGPQEPLKPAEIKIEVEEPAKEEVQGEQIKANAVKVEVNVEAI